jgi:hypothetical protein
VYKPKYVFFSGMMERGIPIGEAHVQLIDKQCVYEGSVKGWYAHGQGTLANANPCFTLTGTWHNSYPSQALLTFKNDPSIISIEFKHRFKTIIHYHDRRVYEGEI